MSLWSNLTRFKPFFSLYNLFHYSKLGHNIPLYRKYGISKSYFSSISSDDFVGVKNAEMPWLDQQDSDHALATHPTFRQLTLEQQDILKNWSKEGYAVLPQFYTPGEVELINSEVAALLEQGKIEWKYKNKLMFAVRKSKKLMETANKKQLTDILDMLLGKKAHLFQSINFYRGSQQPAHSDIVHMTTFPQGFLIAAWIALEDIGEEQGPLFYYPGSHKLPYYMNKDYEHGGTKYFIGDKAYKNYEKAIQELIEKNKLEKRVLKAKKGDVLIWHANLLHGGSPIANKELTRKSMVMHYFAEDVICYHEISQRPALLEKL